MATQSFEEQLTSIFLQFRGSLTELLLAAGADPARPQDVARNLNLDKNLAWKITRIVKAEDPLSAVQHMPGGPGLDILVKAFERGGAAKEVLENTRAAFRAFDKVVEDHLGDRSTLELVLDGLTAGADGARLEASRKLAFRGNSGIWGVQARTRVTTAFVAPNPQRPDFIDAALLGAWIDFRRLRPDASWSLFQTRAYNDDGSPATVDEIPLEPSAATPGGLMLMPSFCTASMPAIHAVREHDSIVYELGDGPIGNTGAFTCVFGSFTGRIGSRYRDATNSRGEFLTMISAPVEMLLFDLIFHHELASTIQPTVDVYRVLTHDPQARSPRDLLPLSEKYQQIGGRPPVVATPLVPRYVELVNSVYRRVGWDPKDFCGIRFVLKYPPFPSMVIIGFPLQDRP